MCLLIYSPAGPPPAEHLANGLAAHPDGWGYCFPRRGQVVIRRGLNAADFWHQWAADASVLRSRPCLWHARWATHGARGLSNCHPFRLAAHHGPLVLAHNGILRMPDHPRLSDTRLFVRDVLNRLRPGFLNDSDTRMLLEQCIGGSKIALLDGDGSAWILNERLGQWDGDCWYSNDSYQSIETSNLFAADPWRDGDLADDYFANSVA